jgi:hypothetical protein
LLCGRSNNDGAELLADHVADLIAGDRRQGAHDGDHRQRRHVALAELLERRVGGEEAGEEQQRVAGQEEADEQTGLGEDDRRQGDPAALLDPVVGEVEQGEHERRRYWPGKRRRPGHEARAVGRFGPDGPDRGC